LHETTSVAFSGLGAELFLFGLDHEQAYDGYKLLFAHLGSFSPEDRSLWRSSIHLVHAKAQDQTSRNRFSERMEFLRDQYLAEFITAEETAFFPPASDQGTEITWDLEDDSALDVIEVDIPPSTIAILDDERFRGFEPISDSGVLEQAIYTATFQGLIGAAEEQIRILEETARS
jgi:hypothetical protein